MALPSNVIRRDVAEAENLRARRRRQRRNRAARLSVPVSNRRVKGNRRGIRHESSGPVNYISTGVEEEKSVDNSPSVLDDILSEPLIRYCEAVVHPFGNSAIGATLPDRYQELVIPLTDRLELDITPDMLNLPGAGGDWQSDPSVSLSGIFFWFQPRCAGGGSITTLTDNVDPVTATYLYNQVPYVCVDESMSAVDTGGILNAYNLCFTGIWTTAGLWSETYGFYQGSSSSVQVTPTYAAIQYSRFANISANCDKIRVLGAGLKIWSEQAPINTGGYSVGGWSTLEDIYSALNLQVPYTPANPGALKAFQPKIKFACRSPGIKGSTVRYSPLQTAEQVESEYPTVPSRFYNILDVKPLADLTLGSPQAILPLNGTDIGIHDMITPGSFVPCVYWSFNVMDAQDPSSSVYTLKVMSMVHSEGTPTGESPFMANKSEVDTAVQHVKAMLENPETFPAATKGHSFKSFLSKTRKVVAKIRKGATKSLKIFSFVDKFLADTSSIL